MAFVTWSDQCSVSIKAMDDQHRMLINIVNSLHDAMKTGKGHEVLGNVLASLVNYTKVHFSSEERLMQCYGYPSYLQHKALHDDLTKQALDIQRKFQAGQPAISVNLLNFLKDWLINHIQDADRQYGTFLNAKGMH